MRDKDEAAADVLSERQRDGIIALLQNVSVAGAAKESGIPESTLYRWLSQATFRDEYRRQRRMLFERAVGLAQRAAAVAIGEAIGIMQHGDNEFARLAAAKMILELARETDIERRVAEIEEMLDEAGAPSDSPTSVKRLRSVR